MRPTKKPCTCEGCIPDLGVKVGQELRLARMIAGLSMAELGARVGVGYTTVQGWESGRNTIPLERLICLGRVLGVDYTEWLP